MSKVLVTKEKLDSLAESVAAKSGVPLTMTIDGMTAALDQMRVPVGDIEITSNGTVDVTDYENAVVNIPVATKNLTVKSGSKAQIYSDDAGYKTVAVKPVKMLTQNLRLVGESPSFINADFTVNNYNYVRNLWFSNENGVLISDDISSWPAGFYYITLLGNYFKVVDSNDELLGYALTNYDKTNIPYNVVSDRFYFLINDEGIIDDCYGGEEFASFDGNPIYIETTDESNGLSISIYNSTGLFLGGDGYTFSVFKYQPYDGFDYVSFSPVMKSLTVTPTSQQQNFNPYQVIGTFAQNNISKNTNVNLPLTLTSGQNVIMTGKIGIMVDSQLVWYDVGQVLIKGGNREYRNFNTPGGLISLYFDFRTGYHRVQCTSHAWYCDLTFEDYAYGYSYVTVEAQDNEMADRLIMRTVSSPFLGSQSYIGPYALAGCSLYSVSFPSCTSIGNSAFYDASIANISFPVCTRIGSSAFYSCRRLNSISFPLCTLIGSGAFYSCASLTTANFPACTSIGVSAFAYCYSLSNISFPVCTQIGSCAFQRCASLTTVSFPACTSINTSAFCSTRLTNAFFPSCINVGSYAFYSCSFLTTASFPVCSSVSAWAFYNCASLTTVSFPACTYIGTSAFGSTKLTTASFSSCMYIEACAFYQCTSLVTLSFPECINIGVYAFYSCTALTTVSFPKCNIVGGTAFGSCTALTTVNLPLCTKINEEAFYNLKSLTTVSIPQCTSIDNHAFSGCTALTTMNLPNCISIYDGAFRGCSQLSNVSAPKCSYIGYYTFQGCELSTAIFPSCTTIGGSAFQSCTSLSIASFPVCSLIATSAFQNCTELVTVNFPSCATIGDYAFSNCKKIATASFPACTSIGGGAFYGCSKLESLYLNIKAVPTLQNTSVFWATPMSNSTYLGHFGSIYVPTSLYNSFRTATNWSIYSNRIVSYNFT